ncbi:MAG: leucine-rich repeat protein, partial [Bacteroidaceae bacterium]|nr:leucine-rich repeat protein [Bacteroidaceae bacterium]
LDGFSFGKSMKTIGEEAFSDCTNLTQLISHAVTPPTCGTQALDDINKWNCTLKIPEGTNSAYMAADQWKEFFFIENLPAGINDIKQDSVKNTPIYNLNGTRVKNTKNMPKGVYIINGKKVMVK